MALPRIVLAAVITSSHAVTLDYGAGGSGVVTPKATSPYDPCASAIPPDAEAEFRCFPANKGERSTCSPGMEQLALTTACYRRSWRDSVHEAETLRTLDSGPKPCAVVAAETPPGVDPLIAGGSIAIALVAGALLGVAVSGSELPPQTRTILGASGGAAILTLGLGALIGGVF